MKTTSADTHSRKNLSSATAQSSSCSNTPEHYGKKIENTTKEEWDRLSISQPQTKPDAADMQASPQAKLPADAVARKAIPVYSGFIRYFPLAIAEVAKVSLRGGIQHGQTPQTLHWDRSKSGDELDAMMRHVLDGDWAQVAWRALANLEKHLEAVEVSDD